MIAGGLAVLTTRFVENPLRFAAPLRRSACQKSRARRRCHRGSRRCGRGAACAEPGRPRPGGSHNDGHRATCPHGGRHCPVRRGSAGRVATGAGRGCGIGGPSRPSRRTSTRRLPTRQPIRRPVSSPTAAFAHFSEVGQPECATGDTASATTVALVGDSHAAMWSPAFQQVAAQRHWRLETLTKAGCPLTGPAHHQPHPSPVNTPSASSGAVRSPPGYKPSTRGWSCSACGGDTVIAMVGRQVSRHTTLRRTTA